MKRIAAMSRKKSTPAPAARDVSGRTLAKGDTVSSVNGQMTGRVWAMQVEDEDLAFVEIKPVHQPYAKSVWYAADQLIWVATPGSGNGGGSSGNGEKPARAAATAGKPATKRTAPAKHK